MRVFREGSVGFFVNRGGWVLKLLIGKIDDIIFILKLDFIFI